jgi:hypothetical protein
MFDKFFGKKEEATKVQDNQSTTSIPGMDMKFDPETLMKGMEHLKSNPEALRKGLATFEEALSGGGGMTGAFLRNGPLKAMIQQAGGAENLSKMLKDKAVLDTVMGNLNDPQKVKQAAAMAQQFSPPNNSNSGQSTANTPSNAPPVTYAVPPKNSKPQKKK